MIENVEGNGSGNESGNGSGIVLDQLFEKEDGNFGTAESTETSSEGSGLLSNLIRGLAAKAEEMKGTGTSESALLQALKEAAEKAEADQKSGNGEGNLLDSINEIIKKAETASEESRDGQEDELSDESEIDDTETDDVDEEAGNNRKKEWTDYRCEPYEVEFSRFITDANNFNAEFYTRSKCESDARSFFKGIYREAETMIQKQHLLDLAIGDIAYYADDCFEEEKIRLQRECPDLDYATLDQYLDLHKFREEIEERLKNIRPSRIRDLEHYLKAVEYESVDGYGDDDGPFLGLISRMKESWNYNGYDAYRELEKDTQKVCDRFAEEATKIARTALKKRAGWISELKKKSGPAEG